MIIFPAIDIKEGKCVRLVKGDFNKITEYKNSPIDQALEFSDFGFNSDKMLVRLSFTDFDGQEFMDKVSENQNIDDDIINKFAPKVVEGVNKLKNWSENL